MVISLVLLIAAYLGRWQGKREAAQIEKHSSKTLRTLLGDVSTEAVRLESVRKYREDLLSSLKKNPPVLPLDGDELPDKYHRAAQNVALADKTFVRTVRSVNGEPLRAAIMNVRRVRPSDLSDGVVGCLSEECYRVDMYNFALNMTVSAIVDVKKMKVRKVTEFVGMQPEISRRLTRIAREIAVNSSLVREALGRKPALREATMSNVKTALTGSRCERSQHLCVAPTFVDYRKNEAVWAIVDLTDMRVVGVQVTELGENVFPAAVSERKLRNDYLVENFCEKNLFLERDDWELDYTLTGSDGLEIRNVRWRGQSVLRSAKLVDWHVSYTGKKIDLAGDRVESAVVDGEGKKKYPFGYSDATGCPAFSTSAVIPFEGPQIEDIVRNGEVVGFVLVQDFRNPLWPLGCNYRYQNRFEFYRDGSFRVAGTNLGRGCGNDGWYRPVFRIDPRLSEKSEEIFAQFSSGSWRSWNKEGWHLQTNETEYSPEGYLFRISDSESRRVLYLEPARGQFGDGDRGDNAYTYVSVRHPDRDEGEGDLITIGPCCNVDYRQGPEKFIDPAENLHNQDLVIWYVPQMKNDDRVGNQYCWAESEIVQGLSVPRVYPCTAGPMFRQVDM